jgi:hypothetical protein
VTHNVSVSSTVSSNNTHVVVVAGGSSASGDVVGVADTGAVVTGVSAWTYLTAGVITLVSPQGANGWTYGAPGVMSLVTPRGGVGGTRVSISNQRNQGGNIVAVYLAGVAATIDSAVGDSS